MQNEFLIYSQLGVAWYLCAKGALCVGQDGNLSNEVIKEFSLGNKYNSAGHAVLCDLEDLL